MCECPVGEHYFLTVLADRYAGNCDVYPLVCVVRVRCVRAHDAVFGPRCQQYFGLRSASRGLFDREMGFLLLLYGHLRAIGARVLVVAVAPAEQVYQLHYGVGGL